MGEGDGWLSMAEYGHPADFLRTLCGLRLRDRPPVPPPGNSTSDPGGPDARGSASILRELIGPSPHRPLDAGSASAQEPTTSERHDRLGLGSAGDVPVTRLPLASESRSAGYPPSTGPSQRRR